MSTVGIVLYNILFLFLILLLVRVVMETVFSFARSYEPRGVVLLILEAVFTVTDPPVNALRRVIPPLRIGSISLDLSFLIVMIAAYVLLRVNRAIFFA